MSNLKGDKAFHEMRKNLGRKTIDITFSSPQIPADEYPGFKDAFDLVEKGDFDKAREILSNIEEHEGNPGGRGYTLFLYWLISEGMAEEADALWSESEYPPMIHIRAKLAHFLGKSNVMAICRENLKKYDHIRENVRPDDKETLERLDRGVAAEYEWIGILNTINSNPHGALEAYMKAYEIFQGQNRKAETTVYNIAILNVRLNRIEESRLWFSKLVRECQVGLIDSLMEKWACDAATGPVEELPWYKALVKEAKQQKSRR